MQIFGYLDLLSAISIFQLLLTQQNNYGFHWLEFFNIIVGASLFVSAYLLIKNKPWGIYLNYLQFIPRIMIYTAMSFGFIYFISSLFEIPLESNNVLVVLLFIVEVIRLIVTIVIHKKSIKLN